MENFANEPESIPEIAELIKQELEQLKLYFEAKRKGIVKKHYLTPLVK